MADRNEGSGSTPWLAFLAGLVLMAVLAVGYFALSNTAPPERQAELQINAPQYQPPVLPPAPPVTGQPAQPSRTTQPSNTTNDTSEPPLPEPQSAPPG